MSKPTTKTTAKHTPGSWERDLVYIVAPDPRGIHPDIYIAEIARQDEEGRIASPEEQLANAKLIAAAPDLLEALECFVNIPKIEQYGFDDEIAQAHAAIAKAKGAETQAITIDDDRDMPVVFEQWSVSDIRDEMAHSRYTRDDLPTLHRLDDDQLHELLEYCARKVCAIRDALSGGLMLFELEEIAKNYFR